MPAHKGATTITSQSNANTFNNGTTITQLGTVIDFGKLPGTVYWNVAYGHTNTSTVGGNFKCILRDQSNNTTLYVFSTNTSAATNTDFSTAVATSVVISSPPVGLAKIGIEVQNTDGSSRTFGLYDSKLYFV